MQGGPGNEKANPVVRPSAVPLLLAACAEVQVKPIPGAANVVVEAPTYKVGDEWRYPGGYFVQVVGFEGDLVITVSNLDPFCRGCRYFRG